MHRRARFVFCLVALILSSLFIACGGSGGHLAHEHYSSHDRAPAPPPQQHQRRRAATNAPAHADAGGGGDAMMSAEAETTADHERYEDHGVNDWSDVEKDALSTFAVDVDTGSYTIMRRKLLEGSPLPEAAVRVEEYVNFFDYDYAAPESGAPFAVHVEAAPSPVAKGRHLLRIGLQGQALSHETRAPANLVFLVDVSGSMRSADKLGLAKQALIYLTTQLRADDTISLVTYAGATRVVLPPTSAQDQGTIIEALEALTAGGSTAMGSGLQLAYEQATAMKKPGAVSRVIVITDGDANVGQTGHGSMLDGIRHHVAEGITLSTIGVGMGNYQDHSMEQLADNGDGNYYYFDTFAEAERVFGEDLPGTLQVIAKDVKIQVDFDPDVVTRYRLIGYENRDVADEDFRDDQVDGGEIGAGHRVTALYEVELADGLSDRAALGDVHVRYKTPDAGPGASAMETVQSFDTSVVRGDFEAASDDLRFAVAVAAFAEVLRASPHARGWSFSQIQRVAEQSAGEHADRQGFLELVGIASRGEVQLVRR